MLSCCFQIIKHVVGQLHSADTQKWWYLGDKIEIIMQTRKLFIAKRCLSMPLTCALCNYSGSCFVVRLDNVISVGENCTTWARILCALNIMANINIILRNWNHSGLIRQNVWESSWLFKSVIKLIFIHSHRIIVHFASVWCFFSLLVAPKSSDSMWFWFISSLQLRSHSSYSDSSCSPSLDSRSLFIIVCDLSA